MELLASLGITVDLRGQVLKLDLDKDTDISLDISEDKEKIVFSTKIKGQRGKIFLITLELDVEQADLIASELLALMGNIMIKNV
jgi:hypothetical protein